LDGDAEISRKYTATVAAAGILSAWRFSAPLRSRVRLRVANAVRTTRERLAARLSGKTEKTQNNWFLFYTFLAPFCVSKFFRRKLKKKEL